LDKSLKPTTTVIYPAKGIEIIDLTVEAIDGTKTNLISFGTGFQLRFRYRASQSIQEVHFGCHIADTTGQRISGGVYPTTPNKGECIKAGEELEILFRFGKGLLPGTYFLGGGIWESQDGGDFLHRVVDYRALKVLHTKAELLIGLCDLTDGAPRLTKEAELEPTTQDPRDQARTASDGIEHDA
jgi:lipopolysaccharide transport system ATP-binding protein